MKKTLKIITILSISLVSLYGFAQEKCKSEHEGFYNPKTMLEKLDAKLHLNETQEKRVFTLLENRFEERRLLKTKMKHVHKQERSSMLETMKSVLTEDQFKKLQALKSKHKSDFKKNAHDHRSDKASCKSEHKHHSEFGPSKRLEYMSKELDLSPRQQETLKTIFQEKRKDIHNKYPELKKERQKLKASFMKDMKAILTPEQFKTFKALKDDHQANRKHLRKH